VRICGIRPAAARAMMDERNCPQAGQEGTFDLRSKFVDKLMCPRPSLYFCCRKKAKAVENFVFSAIY
jgi:hypothetical protein